MAEAKPDTYEPEQTFYEMAYFLLPEYAFGRREKLIQELSRGHVGAIFFYFMTSKAGGKDPDPEIAKQFAVHAGDLDDAHRYYVIAYPSPRPVELDPSTLSVEEVMASMGRTVLAPHYSALIQGRGTDALGYFVLGQSPVGGGTTLRRITPTMNANLGAGSQVELEPFLGLLRTAMAGAVEPVAGISRGQAQAPKRWWQFWK